MPPYCVILKIELSKNKISVLTPTLKSGFETRAKVKFRDLCWGLGIKIGFWARVSESWLGFGCKTEVEVVFWDGG